MLTDKQIQKYQILYKNRFGLDISKEKAIEDGEALVQLLKTIYNPTLKNENESISRQN